jgi:hypothetical protein
MLKLLISIPFLIIGIFHLFKLVNLIESNKESFNIFIGYSKNKLSYPKGSEMFIKLFFRYFLLFLISMFIFSQLV